VRYHVPFVWSKLGGGILARVIGCIAAPPALRKCARVSDVEMLKKKRKPSHIARDAFSFSSPSS
jgi:hypothetical protein